MGEPYIGEIRICTFSFAPRGWAFCNGQLLLIAQNTALFSLLSTYYGGDGRTTFALPNLQGCVPMGIGAGPGLSERSIGERGGQATVVLTDAAMALHQHQVYGSGSDANRQQPDGAAWAVVSQDPIYRNSADSTMSVNALAAMGSSQPHNNMQPYLAVNFIIALEGIYPSRS